MQNGIRQSHWIGNAFPHNGWLHSSDAIWFYSPFLSIIGIAVAAYYWTNKAEVKTFIQKLRKITFRDIWGTAIAGTILIVPMALGIYVFVRACIFPKPPGEFVVTSVLDGDTFYIREREGEAASAQPEMVDLYWIDAPELDQDYGLEAKECLERFVQNSPIDIRTKKKANRNSVRKVEVMYPNKHRIEPLMLKAGCAWYDSDLEECEVVSQGRYDEDEICGPREDLADAQKLAMGRRVGLWRNMPIPPWEWKHSQKGGG